MIARKQRLGKGCVRRFSFEGATGAKKGIERQSRDHFRGIQCLEITVSDQSVTQ